MKGEPRARAGAARWTRALAAYAVVAGASVALAAYFDRNPLETAAWLGTSGVAAAILSLGLGALLATIALVTTRVIMTRAAWARALHADLRPVVRDTDDATLVAIAIASGVGEEILFRGLLVPAIGVVASSLVFGVVHQVRGRARWGWMLWAAAIGLSFALVFRLTGSLLGPLVAHVAINAVNLRVLRDVEPGPDRAHAARRPLGGLLGRRA